MYSNDKEIHGPVIQTVQKHSNKSENPLLIQTCLLLIQESTYLYAEYYWIESFLRQLQLEQIKQLTFYKVAMTD